MKPLAHFLLVPILGLPVTLKAQVSPPTAPTKVQVLTAARDVMQTARYSTLVTLGEDGHPQARIVDPFPPEEDFAIWVGTNPLTRKVAEIGRDPRVTMLYFNPAANEYVTIIGAATLVRDPAEKARHWKAEWSAFYKDGPRGETYLLIRVRPKRLEILSPRHGLMNDPTTWRPISIDFPM